MAYERFGLPVHRTSMQSRSLIRCLSWSVVALLGSFCTAQVMQPPGTFPGQPGSQQSTEPPLASSATPTKAVPHHPAQRAQTAARPAAVAANQPAASPARAPSLLDKPAQPAEVTLHDGLLSVRADNSSLLQILKQLGSSSGMAVDGFQEDQRVFGTYGPGNPGDILSTLLQGAGYNFLMVGATRQGTPREIVLTARGNAGVSGPAPAQQEQPDEDQDNSENDDAPPEQPPVQEAPPVTPPMAPANGAAAPNGRVKTPAEIIQELQRLRQQQQQQNPQ